GLVMWAYAQVGISLEHYTGDQWDEGQHIPRSQLEPGDLVFFFPDIGHVGLYVGNGMMVDAPTFGQPVQVQPVFWSAYVGAVRIVALQQPRSAAGLMHSQTGLTSGKRTVSRTLAPVSMMSSRSIPMPSPPLGGMPYSSACRKSSSSCIASGSPPAASRDCAVSRARSSTGSTSSE